MIHYLLITNKAGNPRVVQYYTPKSHPLYTEGKQRHATYKEVISRCLLGSDEAQNCPFFEYRDVIVVNKKMGPLWFMVAVDQNENILGALELLHKIADVLVKYFGGCSELDLLFGLDRVHMILNEMIVNGHMVQCDTEAILAPVQVMEAK